LIRSGDDIVQAVEKISNANAVSVYAGQEADRELPTEWDGDPIA
jgi:hypothetical protein